MPPKAIPTKMLLTIGNSCIHLDNILSVCLIHNIRKVIKKVIAINARIIKNQYFKINDIMNIGKE